MKRMFAAIVLSAAAIFFAAGCDSSDDETTGASEAAATAKDFYGDDRVGALLDGHPEKIPASLDGYEELFGVGRSCVRKDSKEIFVVEEEQTRLAGTRELHEVTSTKLMPRAVITGCNDGDLSDPKSARKSYSLFAALISDPGMPKANKGDTIRTWPLEVMALDNTTGLYNFYVFEPVDPPSDGGSAVPKNAPGRVTRIYRSVQRDGHLEVMERRLEANKSATREKQPIGGGNRCFNCHVEGGPLMNEARDPWMNWVSFKNTLPRSKLSGLTAELVAEAVPNSETGRASLANDLEPIIRSATSEYVFGASRKSGWANANLDEKQLNGGLNKMLESVFCQTEVIYASASQSIPIEVFVDPALADIASLTPPPSFGSDLVPFQMPVRAPRDQETQNWLVQHEYLTEATALAIRLIDDENDVFSADRCALLPDVSNEKLSKPAKLDELIRDRLNAKIDSLPFVSSHPARAAYIRALLKPGIRREAAQRAYVSELKDRYSAMDKKDKAVSAKERSRKARARDMFSGKSNPRPVLERD